jgi:hypothetical protein
MNSQAAGALEALAFARSKVKDTKARQEIQSAIEDLLAGVGVDFRERIRCRR